MSKRKPRKGWITRTEFLARGAAVGAVLGMPPLWASATSADNALAHIKQPGAVPLRTELKGAWHMRKNAEGDDGCLITRQIMEKEQCE